MVTAAERLSKLSTDREQNRQTRLKLPQLLHGS